MDLRDHVCACVHAFADEVRGLLRTTTKEKITSAELLCQYGLHANNATHHHDGLISAEQLLELFIPKDDDVDTIENLGAILDDRIDRLRRGIREPPGEVEMSD